MKIMKLLCFRIGLSNYSSDMEKDWIDTIIDYSISLIKKHPLMIRIYSLTS